MMHKEGSSPKIAVVLQRYGLAESSVAVALGISFLVTHYKVQGVEFRCFLLAVAITAWYAGTWPHLGTDGGGAGD